MSPRPVHLYLTDTMADWEAGHAIAHIRRPSWQREPGRYEVVTAAATREPVTTMGGARVLPDITLADIDLDTSAMLILTGADTWEDEARHAEVLALARSFIEAGTPVAAICGATFGLARAGLLDERAHTSNAPVFLTASGYAGAHLYRAEPAVTDRGLITASGCFPVAFASHIFAALDLYEPEVLAAWTGLYTTGDESYFAKLAAVAA
jgi:putative intracellular protease/amidase